MKIFATGRQGGKTQRAIEWAVEHDAYIVCHNKVAASQLFRRATDQGLTVHFPLTYDEFLSGSFGPGVKSVVIENVDMLLARFARGVPVIGFTATKDDESFISTSPQILPRSG